MRNKFKILFVDVIDRNINLQRAYPHLGIGYLVSSLRAAFNDLDILVVNRNPLGHIKRLRPDILALSSVTQNFTLAKSIARETKRINPSLPVIVGGAHVSQLPESMDMSMDIGIIGEGEETFVELIRHIRDNSVSPDTLGSVKGLAFWRENKIDRAEPRGAISQLDKLPHPERSILPEKENQLLLTSRGCPFRCAFCASSFFWRGIRYFSPDYVLEEVSRIVKDYPVLNLTIYDDLFISDKKRLEEISAKITQAGYHKRISFWCMARADLIDEETIGYLKRMNVKGVGMGLESGSDRVLAAIKSDNISAETNRRAIELCKKNGVLVHGSFMLGCPFEKEEDMLKTRDFIVNSRIDKGEISVATPLPGTSFWEYALKEKMVSSEMEWSRLAIRYMDELPEGEDFLLLSKEVPRKRFIAIFRQIAEALELKRNEYDKKWGAMQGKEMKLTKFFSLMSLKKLIRDPRRGLRYAMNFFLSVPRRFLTDKDSGHA